MKKNLLVILIIVGALAGGFSGWFWGPQMQAVGFLGDLFLNALRMIVVPIVIFSMIVGVSSLGDIRRVGTVGLKTLAYYFVTTAIAVLIGLVCVNIIDPGVGVSISTAALPESVSGGMTVKDLVLSFVHPNIFAAMAETKMLPLIVFSLVFGGVLTTMGSRGEKLLSLCSVLNEAVIKIVGLVLWFAPIGVFALVAAQLGKSGGGDAFLAEVMKVGKYSATVIIGLAIHGFIILPIILALIGRRSPFKYLWGMMQALVTAFSTSSSAVTLPVTLECAKDENGVNEAAADFVLPIGATINMDGTALYEAVAAMFIAQSYGIELGITQQFIIFITATLASIGAAGIPQAGLVTMVIVLESVGLPLEGIGIILAVDWFLDRCRTTVNVWGDSIGAAVIERCKEFVK
jgi:solute carrier family 1 (neuronal/epithelial high affinity glutamate transporter), member 1